MAFIESAVKSGKAGAKWVKFSEVLSGNNTVTLGGTRPPGGLIRRSTGKARPEVGLHHSKNPFTVQRHFNCNLPAEEKANSMDSSLRSE